MTWIVALSLLFAGMGWYGPRAFRAEALAAQTEQTQISDAVAGQEVGVVDANEGSTQFIIAEGSAGLPPKFAASEGSAGLPPKLQ